MLFLARVVLGTLLGCLWIAPITFIWWFFDVDSRERAWKKHENIVGAIYIVSFIALVVVLGRGIMEFLVFIPPHWGGYDEYGDFLAARVSLGYILGFFAAVFISTVLARVDQQQKTIRRLSLPEEIKRRKHELRYLKQNELIGERKHIEAQLDYLRDRNTKEEPLTSKEEDRIEILDSVFWEIDRLLKAGRVDMGSDLDAEQIKTTEPETTGDAFVDDIVREFDKLCRKENEKELEQDQRQPNAAQSKTAIENKTQSGQP